MRAFTLCCAAFVAAGTLGVQAQGEAPAPLSLLDVPFISQSEALCGGAAAAMVLRYWGEREITAETFAHLVDRSEAGIRTDALVGELRRRGWTAVGIAGGDDALRAELGRGRPVVTLIEDRPSTFHYVVILAWHQRGVVFHDPARGPFVVMTREAFDRRWEAAQRWMAVVVPGSPSGVKPSSSPGEPVAALPSTSCERAVAEGIRQAQVNELGAAERTLAGALGCADAARELAGIRIVQKRWAEAEELAAAAIAQGDEDDYAWKVLATSRFVQNNRAGALAAWNRAGEPRLDLVRIDGLTRTRHAVIERSLDVNAGEILTPGLFLHARRRLADVPALAATRLDYVPVTSGLAELRAAVSERPLFPRGRWPLAVIALRAAVSREVEIAGGSVVGGGEMLSAAWRFWPRRTRVAAGIDAPAPWGGVWGLHGSSERQPFDSPALPPARRSGAAVGTADWLTPHLRWNVAAGLDAWDDRAARARIGGGLQFASAGDRVDLRVGMETWPGDRAFGRVNTVVTARSSTARRGMVLVASAGAHGITARAPLDVWPAGDTGHARPMLLRAHPLLADGAFRVERLGRVLVNGSLEAQHWWTIAGVVGVGGAVFGDAGRTARRYAGGPYTDVDVGVGARLAVPGMTGAFRMDLAKGLRDGKTALSIAYQP
jgi:hypothetical protein